MSWDGWQTWGEFCFAHGAAERSSLHATRLRNVLVRNCAIGRVRLK